MPSVPSPYVAGARNPHRNALVPARDRLAGGMQARSRGSPPQHQQPPAHGRSLEFVPSTPLEPNKKRKASSSLLTSKKTLNFTLSALTIPRVLIWPPKGEVARGEMTCLAGHRLLICLPPLDPSESWTIHPEDIAAVEMLQSNQHFALYMRLHMRGGTETATGQLWTLLPAHAHPHPERVELALHFDPQRTSVKEWDALAQRLSEWRARGKYDFSRVQAILPFEERLRQLTLEGAWAHSFTRPASGSSTVRPGREGPGQLTVRDVRTPLSLPSRFTLPGFGTGKSALSPTVPKNRVELDARPPLRTSTRAAQRVLPLRTPEFFARASSDKPAPRRKTFSLRHTENDSDDEFFPTVDAAVGRSGSRREAQRENDHTVILVYPSTGGRGSLALTEADVARLAPGEWLNDSVIDFALRYLLTQNEATSHSPSADRSLSPRTLASVKRNGNSSPGSGTPHHPPSEGTLLLSAFFYTLLADGYERVRKWTRGEKIFEKEFIVVPINENLHWYLAIIFCPGRILRQAVPLKSPERGSAGKETPGSNPGSAQDGSPHATHCSGQSTDAHMVEADGPSTGPGAALQRAELPSVSPSPTHTAERDRGKPGLVPSGDEPAAHSQEPSDDGADISFVSERFAGPPSEEDDIPGGKRKRPRLSSSDGGSASDALTQTDLPVIITFDSLHSRGNRNVSVALSEWLRAEARDKLALVISSDVGAAYVHAAVPQQPNWWDCGIYVIHFFERFLSSPHAALDVLQRSDPRDPFWKADEVRGKRREWTRRIRSLSAPWVQAQKAHQAEEQAQAEGGGDSDEDVMIVE